MLTHLKYKGEQQEIKKEAEKLQNESKAFLKKHVSLEQSVTLSQLAIAISAISMLTKMKLLRLGSWHTKQKP